MKISRSFHFGGRRHLLSSYGLLCTSSKPDCRLPTFVYLSPLGPHFWHPVQEDHKDQFFIHGTDGVILARLKNQERIWAEPLLTPVRASKQAVPFQRDDKHR